MGFQACTYLDVKVALKILSIQKETRDLRSNNHQFDSSYEVSLGHLFYASSWSFVQILNKTWSTIFPYLLEVTCKT